MENFELNIPSNLTNDSIFDQIADNDTIIKQNKNIVERLPSNFSEDMDMHAYKLQNVKERKKTDEEIEKSSHKKVGYKGEKRLYGIKS